MSSSARFIFRAFAAMAVVVSFFTFSPVLNAGASPLTSLDHEVANNSAGTGLNGGGDAYVGSVSCSSASSCVAGGYYKDGSNHYQAFVSVYNGTTWDDHEVAGELNGDTGARVNSVSCPSASFCVAGGQYGDISNHAHAFVSVYNGTSWVDQEVANNSAGTGLNLGNYAVVNSVSCSSASFCVAGGQYKDGSNHYQAFVSVYNGTSWVDQEVANNSAGTGLNGGGDAFVFSVSCSSASFCVAGGRYLDGSNHFQAFVSVYNGTTWVDQEVGSVLNGGGEAFAFSVSCSSASSCVAGGYYTDASNHYQAFVSVLSVTTLAVTSPPIIYSKPTAPSNVTASMNSGTATVSFTPGSSGNLATYDEIDMYINGQLVGNVCNVTGATSCPIANLGPDAVFSFTVTAINSKGSSVSTVSNTVSYSSPAVVTTTTTSPPTTTTTVPPVKRTITCVKGKTTKKITALSPVCPAGYKKK